VARKDETQRLILLLKGLYLIKGLSFWKDETLFLIHIIKVGHLIGDRFNQLSTINFEQ
jgi:hypothetical protein